MQHYFLLRNCTCKQQSSYLEDHLFCNVGMTWKVEGNSSNCHKIAAPIGIGVQILKTKGVGGGGGLI